MTNREMFDTYAATHDVNIRNRIVESYLYMVDILVRKYLNKGVDYDDLYQVGAMALVFAVDRFDPNKGFEFSSFAAPTILGEIKRYFRDKEWSIKVPRRLKEVSGKIPAAKDELTMKLGRKPTLPELAEYMHYSQQELLEALESSRSYDTFSLDSTFEENGEEGENNFFEKFAAVEDKGYNNVEMKEFVETVLAGLNETEKTIFKGRFLDNLTQTELAEKLGVSQMTISRAEKGLKKKIRQEYLN